MGTAKQVVIESKFFEVVRDGSFVFLTEKGCKVVKEIRLGLGTTRWFIKALEDCLKAVKEFYSAHREGRAMLHRDATTHDDASWH